MRECPVCGGEPGVLDNDGMVGCRACQVFAPSATWALMPRVAPNAEALVDAFEAQCDNSTVYRDDAARAELLRACVVDAAEMATLRKERDEQARAVAASMEAIEGLRNYAARLTVERDEAVARLKTCNTIHTPECDYMGCCSGGGIIGHATGVPESELTNAEQCARREDSELRAIGATPAAPPSDDADALLDALVLAIASNLREAKWQEGVDAARAAVRARMRPWPTAEQLMAEMLEKHRFARRWQVKKRTVMEHMGAALRRMAGVLAYACDDCGIVKVDEDACCIHCGADTTTVNAAWWNDSPLTGGGK